MLAMEYQDKTDITAIYGQSVEHAMHSLELDDASTLLRLMYCTLKLNGEAGEVAEHIGKALRDDAGIITHERRALLEKEIGDVMWYVSQLCTELQLDLGLVMQANLTKLMKRQEEGKLHGSGSDR